MDHGKHPHRAEKNIHPIQSDKQQPFIHFAKTERAKLKEVMRNLTFAEASSTLGQIWNNAPEEKRKPHLDWEVKDRAIYNGKRHHGEKIIQSSARSERSELSPQDPNTSLANLITQQKTVRLENFRTYCSTDPSSAPRQAPCCNFSCTKLHVGSKVVFLLS